MMGDQLVSGLIFGWGILLYVPHTLPYMTCV
jgi:hypothetical protein